MTNDSRSAGPAGTAGSAGSAGSAGRSRRRRWGWILTGSIVLIAVVVVAIGLFIRFQPTPSPLALPPATGREPPGNLDGTWNVVGGSVAGFRVQESFVGFSNDVVGRTNAVTGTVSLSGDQVVGATSASASPRYRSTGSHNASSPPRWTPEIIPAPRSDSPST